MKQTKRKDSILYKVFILCTTKGRWFELLYSGIFLVFTLQAKTFDAMTDKRTVSSVYERATYCGQMFLKITGNRAYAIHFDDKGFMYIVTGDAEGNGALYRVAPDGEKSFIASFKGSFIGPGLDMMPSEISIFRSETESLKSHRKVRLLPCFSQRQWESCGQSI